MDEHPEQRRTTVFYPQRRGVSVTDKRLTIYGRVFAVNELANIGWGMGPLQVARRVAMQMIAVEAALVAVIVALSPSVVAVATVAVYLLVSALSLLFSAWRWPTPLQLSALYRGELVVLFVSIDHTEFHQVCRALLRATELHRRRVAV